MSDDRESLILALEERDKLRSYISKLDQLLESGELSEEQATPARSDYSRRIAAADSAVKSLKSKLRHQLEGIQHEAQSRKADLGRLRARHKVGELTLSKYRSEEKRLKSQLDTLERDERDLTMLLDAETAEVLEIQSPHRPATPAARRRMTGSRSVRALAGRFSPKSAHPGKASSMPNSPLRIGALVFALLLLVSVRLPWLEATELLGTDLPSEPGISVSFLAGLAALVCGLGALAAGFLASHEARGLIHAGLGALACVALIAAVFLGEVPLHDSYFMELVSLRIGFFLYVAAAVALGGLGIAERIRAT